jgi:hypothetical protein
VTERSRSPYALWRYLPVQRVMIVGIPLAFVGLTALVLVRGDGHVPPPYVPREVRALTVCGSAAAHVRRVESAAAAWRAAGFDVPPPSLGGCAMPPGPGEVQVRACSDVVVGWGSCSAEQDGATATIGDASIVYVERFPSRACIVAHEIGHALGFGHATGASSVMHESCGTRYPSRADYP